ncbi:MAG: ABC transporter substrate-binding protein [Bacilli bacterium]|jgi:ABC-type branched-subunit amino acid transport system substrate-binding protein|nr:ABC transporter substrate-binding protein [Bacilli bacterium]NLN80754.1 ABC transporter substrate-binding protein [Erysipelotrichia bacterium]
MKKINLFVLTAVSAILLAACEPAVVPVKQYDGTEVQGISATEILVGNTAATTGSYAVVGVPFNYAIEAVFEEYNEAGGFEGKNIVLQHYDDYFDGAVGKVLTEKLVETDEVFALVGHFGTNTVGATVDYIKEIGIPMVYAATGISDLYQEEAEGYNKAVMPVQPIYDSEGRFLLARALAEHDVQGLKGTKIGVIEAKDDAGSGMVYGVKAQAKLLKNPASILYVETPAEQGTNHAAAVNKLKDAECDVVIIAANQIPFSEILNYMRDANYNAKVITSYVTANAITLGAAAAVGSITADRPVYTNSWLDIADAEGYLGLSAEYWEFATLMMAHDKEEGAPTGTAYAGNSYAIAGYVAAKVFLEGLKRVKEKDVDLVWKTYIEAMEKDPISLPMGGEIDFANGRRYGAEELGLNYYFLGNPELELPAGLAGADTLRTLDYVWDLVPADLKA